MYYITGLSVEYGFLRTNITQLHKGWKNYLLGIFYKKLSGDRPFQGIRWRIGMNCERLGGFLFSIKHNWGRSVAYRAESVL